MIISKEKSTVFSAVPGPSIFLVTTGKGKINLMGSSMEDPIHEGDVFFAPANAEIGWTSSVGELEVYRAGINGRFLKVEVSGVW